MLTVDLGRLGREGSLPIEGAIEAERLADEAAPFRFDGPAVVDLHAQYTGSGEIVVRGRVRGRLRRECRRCLKALERELDEEITMVFAPSDELQEEDGEVRVIDPSVGTLDLVPSIREELLLAVPPYVECRPDCRGLCPQCGINLNEGECDCGGAEPDSRWDALRALQDE